MSELDPYRVLGVGRDATPEEVRAAFRKAVREHHPDTAARKGRDSDVQRIVDAYHLLIDPDSRAHFESRGARPGTGARGRKVDVSRGDSTTSTPPPGGAICTRCEGRGSRRVERPCPVCHGRAEVTVLDSDRAGVVRCRRCSGRGSLPERVVCDACAGSGRAQRQ